MTNTSVHNNQKGNNVIEAMAMGDRENALYDNGFYNIGVTLTTDDIGRGGKYPSGAPLASARQALFHRLGIEQMKAPIIGNKRIPAMSEDGLTVCTDSDEDGFCDGGASIERKFRRAAVDGAFKTPTIRGVELTGPYFHNGGWATLKQVVQFYDRGGKFCDFNLRDLDPAIQRLNLSDRDEENRVRFMQSTTEDRVRYRKALFDHPQRMIPNGHQIEHETILEVTSADGVEQATDDLIVIDAVGKNDPSEALNTFLGLDPQDAIFEPRSNRSCNEPPQRAKKR